MLNNLLLNNPAGDEKLYVEDVFSTYLYRDTNNYVTVNNGIDLLNKGGMVWLKNRAAVDNHRISDTVRGAGYIMSSNNTTAQYYEGAVSANAFYSNGFRAYSQTGDRWVSWTFRKAAKFFDVVGVTGQATQTTFNHSLGVAPGFIVIRDRTSTGNWFVYHRSAGSDQYLQLESSNAQAAYTGWCTADSTSVTVKSGVMSNGSNYVVYLFAHDTTADGIIQCGSYTGNGSTTPPVIDLGWEPQWLLVKPNISGQQWRIFDDMRGFWAANGTSSTTPASRVLYPNFSDPEDISYFNSANVGFTTYPSNGASYNQSGVQYLYVAIRRGPMKTPTSGTSVFTPIINSGASGTQITTNFPVDATLQFYRPGALSWKLFTRLTRGTNTYNNGDIASVNLETNNTSAEGSTSSGDYLFDNTGFLRGGYIASSSLVYLNFRRAPSFFDVVCYKGDGTNGRSISHNLGAVPEMIIVKDRNFGGTFAWFVGHKDIGSSTFQDLQLRSDAGTGSISVNAFPSNLSGYTATTFIVNQAGLSGAVNLSGEWHYVAYLFASCPGVSKVGSYTGNGSSQTINCGFAAGARFVMIKRTNSAGDWYVWDTARGIVAANDPHLSLNSTAAEVTTNDTIDPDNTGFVVNQVAATNVNVNGATYIYLAIA